MRPRSADVLSDLERAQLDLVRERRDAIDRLMAARALPAGIERDSRIALAEARIEELNPDH